MTAPIAVDDIETIDGAGRVPSPEVVDVDVPGLEPGLGGEDGPEGEVSGQERARRLA